MEKSKVMWETSFNHPSTKFWWGTICPPEGALHLFFVFEREKEYSTISIEYYIFNQKSVLNGLLKYTGNVISFSLFKFGQNCQQPFLWANNS